MIKINDINNKYGIDIGNRWATIDEIKSISKRIDINGKGKSDAAGIPLFFEENNSLYVDNSDSHTLIFGNTGAKKSRLVAMPLIYTLAKAGESIIVSDPKGELYDRTSSYLQKNGYDISCINLRDIGSGQIWNPFTNMYNLYKVERDKAMEMVSDFVSILIEGNSRKADASQIDPFWNEMAGQLLIANIQLLFETGLKEEINVKSLTKLANQYGEEESLCDNLLYKISRCINRESLTYMQYAGLFNVAERTRFSIQASLYAILSIFLLNSSLTNYLSQPNEIDVRRLKHTKSAIFIIFPDEKNTYNQLVSIFLKEAYIMLINEAQKMLQEGKKGIRTNFILDEFCNLPYINDFNSMISASRSRDIRYFLFSQGLEQLRSKYNSDADTIIGNCNNIVYLHSKEYKLLEYLERLCGEVTYYGKYEYTRPLISTTELQHLSKEEGEVLMLISRNKPFITKLPDIDEYKFPIYKSLVQKRIVERKVPVLDCNKILRRYTPEELSKMFC